MKAAQSKKEKPKRSAEDWVTVAREFGEKCLAIQHDPKLNIDQKLEKQKVLSNQMAKEIQEDSHLTNSDKKQMIASINSYMDEWESMHNAIQQGSNLISSKGKKSEKKKK